MPRHHCPGNQRLSAMARTSRLPLQHGGRWLHNASRCRRCRRPAQATGEQPGWGQVKDVDAREWRALEAKGWVLLDVRPKEEVARAAVRNSINVPLFVVDDDPSLAGRLKQLTAAATIGLWSGDAHTKMNPAFMSEVLAKLPDKSTPLCVACQKGRRSLMACEQLVRAGYTQVSWLLGGFDAATKEDMDTVSGVDIRYGGIGGLSAMLGMTEVQEEERARERTIQ